MTEEERLNKMGELWTPVFQQAVSELTPNYVSTEEIRTQERRIEELQAKIMAGDESLFNEFAAAGRVWGRLVKKQCINTRQEDKPVSLESLIPKKPQDDFDLFAEFQTTNQK